MSRPDRRSDGGRRDKNRNDNGDSAKRQNRERTDDNKRRDHQGGHRGNNMMERGGGGGGHQGMMMMMMPPGGPGGRGASSFNGMAFTDSELMTDLPKKKFTGRCRLFVGNLPNEVKEAELKELFQAHGDIAECYLSGKGFAFLRLDTRANAESAKEAIDGKVIHGRQVRVRFAVHGAALRVKELSPTVSNEMLYHAFSHFGEVERAVHIVDEKGRPTGEGIVEFERKPSCNEAIAAVREKVFLLTANPKPLIVEPLEPRDEDDGLAERMIPRTPQLNKERELGPRFPTQNSFEFVYGMKWKELYEMEKQRRTQLEDELKEGRRRLEQDMELAYQDYQAQMLREDLQRRQQELERLEAARRERMASIRPGGPMGVPPPGGPFGGPPQGYGQQGMGMQYGGSMGGGPPQMHGGPMGGGPMGGGPPPMHGGPMAGGPPQMHGGPPQMHGGPPMGGPPQGQQQQQQFNQGPPPQQGGRPGGPGGPSGPSGDGRSGAASNMIEGVQRLLQIFKNEPSGGPPGRGPQDFSGPPPVGSMFTGAPGGQGGHFGGDYPPEKRMRR